MKKKNQNPSLLKGGLFSENFSLWLKSPKQKSNKSLSWAPFPYVDSAQNSDLAPFSGDLSQSEKLSENKPPLMWFQVQSKAKDSI